MNFSIKDNLGLTSAFSGSVEAPRVLVVDDSRAQRMTLSALLRRAGYAVEEADCGEAALAACRDHPADLVLSDWVMPGMDGLELCRALRALGRDSYGYFILLTSKGERSAIAQGLETGADDFLTKPVNGTELRARLNAGKRIVDMQRELVRKNRMIGDALTEVQRLYDLIDRDLREARKLQEALVRDSDQDLGAAHMSLFLRSSGHVGGDLVGHFRAGDTQLGVYSIDVSGHGISSALMAARLAGHLSAASPEYNIALERVNGGFRVLPTDVVVSRLNEMMHHIVGTEHYFTIALAVLDMKSGLVRLTQAGHPHPLVQRSRGTVSIMGKGGLPVGLLEQATWSETRFYLSPGDRLFICSDGITECPGTDGQLLEETGLARMLGHLSGHAGSGLMTQLMADLVRFHGAEVFPDDISAVMVEYRGL